MFVEIGDWFCWVCDGLGASPPRFHQGKLYGIGREIISVIKYLYNNDMHVRTSEEDMFLGYLTFFFGILYFENK